MTRHPKWAKHRINIMIAGAVLAVFAALSYVGEGDYEEALMQEQEYCARVADGTHRDWNDAIDCD